MAKLSAYGQREIVRLSKEFPGHPDGSTIWERREMAIMSNGRMLDRHIVKFPPGPYDGGKPVRHDFGWKVRMAAGRVSLGKVRGWTERKEAEGWTVEKGEGWHLLPAPVPAPSPEGNPAPSLSAGTI